jgi:hypothetical protein
MTTTVSSVAEDTDAALAIVRREQPKLARRMAETLGSVVIRAEVDGESFEIVARRDEVGARAPRTPAPDVLARTSRATIRAVLGGAKSLDEAILDDSVELFGAPDQLVQLEDLLALFVNAAVRSPSMTELWERFVDTTLEGLEQ